MFETKCCMYSGITTRQLKNKKTQKVFMTFIQSALFSAPGSSIFYVNNWLQLLTSAKLPMHADT